MGAQLLPDTALSVSDTLTAALDQFLPAVSVIPWEKCCPNPISIFFFFLNLAFSHKSQQSSLITETKEKDHCWGWNNNKRRQIRSVTAGSGRSGGAGGQVGGTVDCPSRSPCTRRPVTTPAHTTQSSWEPLYWRTLMATLHHDLNVCIKYL